MRGRDAHPDEYTPEKIRPVVLDTITEVVGPNSTVEVSPVQVYGATKRLLACWMEELRYEKGGADRVTVDAFTALKDTLEQALAPELEAFYQEQEPAAEPR
jgi:hypothetical protein